jgi:hypothetical protein
MKRAPEGKTRKKTGENVRGFLHSAESCAQPRRLHCYVTTYGLGEAGAEGTLRLLICDKSGVGLVRNVLWWAGFTKMAGSEIAGFLR